MLDMPLRCTTEKKRRGDRGGFTTKVTGLGGNPGVGFQVQGIRVPKGKDV